MLDSSYEEQSQFMDLTRKDKQVRDSSIIKQAKQYFRNKSIEERLQYALLLFSDAMNFRFNRSKAKLSANYVFSYIKCSQIAYQIQTSNVWRRFMLVLAYIFMFLICISVTKPTSDQFYIEVAILIFLWADVCLDTAHKFVSFKNFINLNSSRYYIKVIVLSLLTIDQLISIIRQENDFRFFIFLRAALPSFYDTSLRQKIEAVFKIYKDFLVYVLFFLIVILSFGIITSTLVKIPQDKQYNQFTQNYNSLPLTMFLFYIMSTYDSFPDNQMLAMQIMPFIQVIFVMFLFLNILVFSIVPTSLLYKQFRKIYAKEMLLDEIKQQHNLIYVFLALSDEQIKVSRSKLIQFLFNIYRKNSEYIEHISSICLQLNHHESQYIQIYQFIGLCKIIQSNTAMLPLTYPNCKVWNNFCHFLEEIFGLKEFISNLVFKGFIAIVIFLSILNSLLVFYHQNHFFYDFDRLFTITFCLQILLKILGNGLEIFFRDTFNIFDFITISGMVISSLLYPIPLQINFQPMFKLLRFYRILILGKQVVSKKQFISRKSLFVQSARLTNQAMIISPIVLSFFPLLLFASYQLGVLGMWIFHQPSLIQTEDSPYSKYNQFSNFRNFIYSQFINVQIMVEAGWSSVVFDHAYRYGKSVFIILYFTFCHLIIVTLILPLFKGIVWDLYETVHEQINLLAQKAVIQQKNRKNLQIKRFQLLQIEKDLERGEQRNTIQYHRIIQNKIDQIILQQLKQASSKASPRSRNHIIVDQIEEKQVNSKVNINYYHKIIENIHQKLKFQSIAHLQVQDIEFRIQKLTQNVKINCYQVPKKHRHFQLLSKLIKLKFKKAGSSEIWFDEKGNICGSDQSIRDIRSMLNTILSIKNLDKKNIKQSIRDNLNKNQIHVSSLEHHQVKKKNLVQNINQTLIMRKTFLQQNQSMIRRFCHENISSLYPNHFNNGLSMDNFDENLFSWLSRSLYSLKSILRYKQIDYKVFFSIMTQIQNIISSKVLRLGTIFKFVFEMCEEKIWFTIEFNELKELRIHFLKKGVWIWVPQFESEIIYTAKDLFNLQDCSFQLNDEQKKISTILMTQLFQSFETIALSLKSRQLFFSTDPKLSQYNAYALFKEIKYENKKVQKSKISKIMIILLENQKDRDKILDINLTKMQRTQGYERKPDLNIHQDRNDIKIRKKTQIIQDQIRENKKKTPQIVALNILTQIKQILTLHSNNFCLQLDRLLTETYFNKKQFNNNINSTTINDRQI